ncbi:hypothetical protein PN836_011905 [Ningiella sp. W23]
MIEVNDPDRGEETEQSDNSATSLFETIANNTNIPTEVANRTA